MRKKNKIICQQKNRLEKKVAKLGDVIDSLKEEKLISGQALDALEHFKDVPTQLYQRYQRNKTAGTSSEKYSPELRSFALTLAFYSGKAYRFAREKFGLALPHPTTIR